MTEVSNATRMGRYLTAVVALLTFAACVYLYNHHLLVLQHLMLSAFTVCGLLIFVQVAIPISVHLSYAGLKDAYEEKKASESKLVQVLVYLWPITSGAVFMNLWWVWNLADFTFWYVTLGLVAYILNIALGTLTAIRFWANKPPKA